MQTHTQTQAIRCQNADLLSEFDCNHLLQTSMNRKKKSFWRSVSTKSDIVFNASCLHFVLSVPLHLLSFPKSTIHRNDIQSDILSRFLLCCADLISNVALQPWAEALLAPYNDKTNEASKRANWNRNNNECSLTQLVIRTQTDDKNSSNQWKARKNGGSIMPPVDKLAINSI